MTDTTPATLGIQLVETRIGRPVSEHLHQAYIVEGKTQAEIATELGVDPATVSRWMVRFGIQSRVIGHRKRRSGA